MEMTMANTETEATARGSEQIESAQMFEDVYNRLRVLAERHFRQLPTAVSLQPTALVHELFLRLARNPLASFNDREHFLATAATAMRQIAIDRARRRSAGKRGGGCERVEFTDALIAAGDGACASIDMVAVDELITRLARVSPRQARVVELRVFVGMTVPEIATALGVSVATVEKDWRGARAWLRVQLARSSANETATA